MLIQLITFSEGVKSRRDAGQLKQGAVRLHSLTAGFCSNCWKRGWVRRENTGQKSRAAAAYGCQI